MENKKNIKLTQKKWVKKIACITFGMIVLFILPGGTRGVYALETVRKTTSKKGFPFQEIKEKAINFLFEKKETELQISKTAILATSIVIIVIVSIYYQSQTPSISKQLVTKQLKEVGPSIVTPLLFQNTPSWELLKANKTVGFAKTVINPFVQIMLQTNFQEMVKKQQEQENITKLIFTFKEFKGI